MRIICLSNCFLICSPLLNLRLYCLCAGDVISCNLSLFKAALFACAGDIVGCSLPLLKAVLVVLELMSAVAFLYLRLYYLCWS
jgi:hypothetical protein